MNIYEKLQDIQQKLKAPKDLHNSFGNYDYRSCESILEALKPLLNANGLFMTLSDKVVQIGDRYYLEATCMVTDGEIKIETTASAREQETKKGMDEAQVTGAASSYARKYALNGMFCINDEKDPDGLPPQKSNNKEKSITTPSGEFATKEQIIEWKEKVSGKVYAEILTANKGKLPLEIYSKAVTND